MRGASADPAKSERTAFSGYTSGCNATSKIATASNASQQFAAIMTQSVLVRSFMISVPSEACGGPDVWKGECAGAAFAACRIDRDRGCGAVPIRRGSVLSKHNPCAMEVQIVPIPHPSCNLQRPILVAIAPQLIHNQNSNARCRLIQFVSS